MKMYWVRGIDVFIVLSLVGMVMFSLLSLLSMYLPVHAQQVEQEPARSAEFLAVTKTMELRQYSEGGKLRRTRYANIYVIKHLRSGTCLLSPDETRSWVVVPKELCE